jgi:hypothetical protein
LVAAGVSASAAVLVALAGAARVPTLRVDVGTAISSEDLVSLAKLGIVLMVGSPQTSLAGCAPLRLSSTSGPSSESKDAGAFDFHVLGESMHWWKTIRLRRRNAAIPYAGADFLRNARSLVDLRFQEFLDFDVDLSELPELRYFEGGPSAGRSAAINPGLENLSVNFGSEPPRMTVDAPVKVFRLAGSELRDVEFIHCPESATEMTISESSSLDVATIERCSALEVLRLERCAKVKNVATLLRLPNLRALFILQCREVENAEALLDLDVPILTVEPNRSFDERFRVKAAERPRWAIAPQRNVKREVTGTTAIGSARFRIERLDNYTWDASARLVGEIGGLLPSHTEVTAELVTKMLSRVLMEHEPQLMDGNALTVEVDDDVVHLTAHRRQDARRAVAAILAALEMPGRLVAIAREPDLLEGPHSIEPEP